MSSDKNEYIIEYFRLGGYVKVSAIDPVTEKEVCVIVPSRGVTEKQMQDLAIRKLQSALKKESD
jgi:hypothetical protein